MTVAEKEVVEKPAVVSLKGTQKPPIGELYYGKKTDLGLQEVLFRTERMSSTHGAVFTDTVTFYEKVITLPDGAALKVAFYPRSSPPPPDLFPEYCYPAAQWNISQALLDEQDNIPEWQARVVLSDEGNPTYLNGQLFYAFHYIVVNRRFLPEERPDGSTNDGHFVPLEPVSGEFILEREEAKRKLGGDVLGMTRRRVE